MANSGLVGYNIHFQSYKHSGNVRPILEITKQLPSSVCPVQLLSSYFVYRGMTAGSLYVTQSGKAVTRLQFQTVFYRCLSYLGISTVGYNTHSFRIGSCTDMVKEGVSDTKIRSVGRWKSDAYKLYVRPPNIVV